MKLLLITNDGWPVAQPRFTRRPSASTRIARPSSNVNLSTAPTVAGLMLTFLALPAFTSASSQAMSISRSKWPMLQTIASFFICDMCSPRMMSQQPVVVTKMSPCAAASSIVVTSIAFHRGLQGADGVDLGDDHAGAEAAHRVGTALADVAVAGDDDDLAGDHDVGRPLDAVGQRLAAAVEVVELALGDRVVDVDRRHLQLAALVHLVEAMDARGRFFGEAADAAEQLGELVVDHGGQVAAVVEDHVERLARRGRTASARCTSRTPALLMPFQA